MDRPMRRRKAVSLRFLLGIYLAVRCGKTVRSRAGIFRLRRIECAAGSIYSNHVGWWPNVCHLLSAVMPPPQLAVGATHDFQLSATDGLSGIASKSCTPIDTSTPSVPGTPGTPVASCTAIGRAGNISSLSAEYVVVSPKSHSTADPGHTVQRPIRHGVKPAKPLSR
jgi:hypothetical protein